MPTPPFIGLTVDRSNRPGRYEIHCDYAESIEKAGGIPLLIPYRTDYSLIPELLDRLDGVLLIGGDDLDPELYGQQWHPEAIRLDPERQGFELALLAEVERRRMPVLGICLGCQVINVYRGGSLHQFIPEVARAGGLEHRRLDRDQPRHPVRLEGDSLLAGAIGKTEILANTYHKQAVDRVGRGLRVVGRAPDGIIEAMEDPALPLFATVQWHPERLNHEPDHLAVFRLLVEKCADRP